MKSDSFILVFALIFIVTACNNDKKGIEGNNNRNNNVIIGENNVISTNSIPKYKGKTTVALNEFIKKHEGEIVYLDIEFTREARQDIVFWNQIAELSDMGIRVGDEYEGQEEMEKKHHKEFEEANPFTVGDFRILEGGEDRVGKGVYGIYYIFSFDGASDYIIDGYYDNALFLSGNFKVVGLKKSSFEGLLDCYLQAIDIEKTR